MATTNLIPLHVGKKRTAGSSIARVIQYVKNPEKTKGESLVAGYGCNPALADAEFMFMKKTYLDRTGRYRGKDDVIAYHMRQAFLPGEITPEENWDIVYPYGTFAFGNYQADVAEAGALVHVGRRAKAVCIAYVGNGFSPPSSSSSSSSATFVFTNVIGQFTSVMSTLSVMLNSAMVMSPFLFRL